MKSLNRLILVSLSAISISVVVTACSQEDADTDNELILATTTSTYDSGLLDYILPGFEEEYGVAVSVVAVGTGQALTMGEEGDADVLLVHARTREEAFVEAGHGTERYDVMYNDFVLAGPPADPAQAGSAGSVAAAFSAIADTQSTFVSRGDDSGTHIKELSIWDAAGITPSGDWYMSAGQGMGGVLTMANELDGYTLSDRSTFISRQGEDFTPVIIYEGDAILFNPYSVIPVDPSEHPDVNYALAEKFAEWLTSVETQELIASYMVNNQQLFFPDSAAWREANP